MEKIVLKRLLEHIERNNLNEKHQSAYKIYHSTETATLKITSDILDSLDDRKICLLTLLDLSAAFDTINHNILIKRLKETFGITGTCLSWFESYIRNRKQCVKIGNENSCYSTLNCGVPQGSVLGPIIFTMYTQPLADILEHFDMQYHFYADDSQIYKVSDYNQLADTITSTEKCLSEIKTWMDCNKLKPNEQKTEIMLCSKQHVKNLPHVEINFNGHKLLSSSSLKNLGVFLEF